MIFYTGKPEFHEVNLASIVIMENKNFTVETIVAGNPMPLVSWSIYSKKSGSINGELMNENAGFYKYILNLPSSDRTLCGRSLEITAVG